MKFNYINEFSIQVLTNTFGGASFGSVPPQAEFEKCAAYFSKEPNAAPKKVRSHAGCGGEYGNSKTPAYNSES